MTTREAVTELYKRTQGIFEKHGEEYRVLSQGLETLLRDMWEKSDRQLIGALNSALAKLPRKASAVRAADPDKENIQDLLLELYKSDHIRRHIEWIIALRSGTPITLGGDNRMYNGLAKILSSQDEAQKSIKTANANLEKFIEEDSADPRTPHLRALQAKLLSGNLFKATSAFSVDGNPIWSIKAASIDGTDKSQLYLNPVCFTAKAKRNPSIQQAFQELDEMLYTYGRWVLNRKFVEAPTDENGQQVPVIYPSHFPLHFKHLPALGDSPTADMVTIIIEEDKTLLQTITRSDGRTPAFAGGFVNAGKKALKKDDAAISEAELITLIQEYFEEIFSANMGPSDQMSAEKVKTVMQRTLASNDFKKLNEFQQTIEQIASESITGKQLFEKYLSALKEALKEASTPGLKSTLSNLETYFRISCFCNGDYENGFASLDNEESLLSKFIQTFSNDITLLPRVPVHCDPRTTTTAKNITRMGVTKTNLKELAAFGEANNLGAPCGGDDSKKDGVKNLSLDDFLLESFSGHGALACLAMRTLHQEGLLSSEEVLSGNVLQACEREFLGICELITRVHRNKSCTNFFKRTPPPPSKSDDPGNTRRSTSRGYSSSWV